MKKIIKRFVEKLGYDIKKISHEKVGFSPKYSSFNEIDYEVIENDFFKIYEVCKTETMTSIEKLYSLYCSVNYVLDNNIQGDFVECGVWRGGSAMLMALILQSRNKNNRKIFLYDTFNGMTAPTEHDIHVYSGKTASHISQQDYNSEHSKWCNASINIVKENMDKTGYQSDKIIYVEGRVEDTIPENLPQEISLLRLDTDFYESTLHELNYLFPLLSKNGVLLSDDYGFWEGQKKATDRYFKEHDIHLLMHRIDYAGRVAIKI